MSRIRNQEANKHQNDNYRKNFVAGVIGADFFKVITSPKRAGWKTKTVTTPSRANPHPRLENFRIYHFLTLSFFFRKEKVIRILFSSSLVSILVRGNFFNKNQLRKIIKTFFIFLIKIYFLKGKSGRNFELYFFFSKNLIEADQLLKRKKSRQRS